MKELDAKKWKDELLNRHFESRKHEAEWILDTVPKELQGIVFSMLDGKDYSQQIWRMIRPDYSKPFWKRDVEE